MQGIHYSLIPTHLHIIARIVLQESAFCKDIRIYSLGSQSHDLSSQVSGLKSQEAAGLSTSILKQFEQLQTIQQNQNKIHKPTNSNLALVPESPKLG